LFCIRPFNRNYLLQLLFESLLSIKHVGKYFILASFYKEAIKDCPIISFRKRKFFLRKDCRYPSVYTKNLEDMKQHLGCFSNQDEFPSVLREALDSKIIKNNNPTF
jgi:hypothetical protein